ncbi:MAG TPA: response regulator [Acidimicrobiales bacterium]|nr:response regulator [Acidimicrobiales bacterium]
MPSAPLVRAVIVDDEPDIRDRLQLRLERHGQFAVVGVGGDGPEAVALCARHKPDVLVLDATLPSGPGTDVVRDILAAAPSTMVIIFTGDIGTATRDAAERVGAHAVIGKLDPFDRLVGTIFRLLPDKAPIVDKDDFGEQMTSLLEADGEGRGKGPWWRSGARSRVMIAVLVLVVLPLLAAAAWVIATIAGMAL